MNADSLAALETQGQVTREALYPAEVTVGTSGPHPASVTYGEFEESLRDGGIALVQGCSVTIRKELLATRPQRGTEIAIAGNRSFWIQSVLGDDDPVSWLLRCSLNRN